MSEPQMDRQVRRRLAVLRHAEEVTGNVAMTCRYFGISSQLYYTWLRRYRAEGPDGLRERSKAPKTCPNATSAEVVGKIIHLRQNYHFGPTKIAMYLIGDQWSCGCRRRRGEPGRVHRRPEDQP